MVFYITQRRFNPIQASANLAIASTKRQRLPVDRLLVIELSVGPARLITTTMVFNIWQSLLD